MLYLRRYLILLMLLFSWAGIMSQDQTVTLDSDKVNLALRRAADHLLRASGDSVSRIPAVERTGEKTWRIMMEVWFEYDSLPRILQASVARYDLSLTYQVAVKRCDNHQIDLGYFQKDFEQDSMVPCLGRQEPEGCHYIEVTFLDPVDQNTFWASTSILLVLTLVTGSGAWIYYRKNAVDAVPVTGTEELSWISFGHSRLNTSGQTLECNGHRVSLTYREAKLLRLMASHPGQLLEREFILNEVWGDEGIQVSRSVDMFISRLRKKLAPDPSVSITAVHGVGYRMEIEGIA